MVGGRARDLHLRLGGEGEGRGGGWPGPVLVVGEDAEGVGGGGEEALQGDLLQAAPGSVHHPLPAIASYVVVLWIRIQMDPHHFNNLDPHPF